MIFFREPKKDPLYKSLLGKLIWNFLKKFEKKSDKIFWKRWLENDSVRADVPFFLAFIRINRLNLNEIISWVPIWVAILCFWQMNVILRVKIWVLNKYDLNSMTTKMTRGLIWSVILYDFRFVSHLGGISANGNLLQIFVQETPYKN